MASSNIEFHSKTNAVLLAAPHISGGNKEGLQHRTDSPPYRRSAWTTFDQRERSESHASVIPGDKGRGFEFKAARAEPTGSVWACLTHQSRKNEGKKKKTGDSVCFSFLMTDEDKNVKNRICVVHLHFNSCFFFLQTSGNYRAVCAFLSASTTPSSTPTFLLCVCVFPIKSYGGAEKSLRRLWEGLAPTNHLLQ